MEPIRDTYVTLPDHTWILIQYMGRVKRASHIVLDSIQYVPHFKFNLISLSALVRQNYMSLNFTSHAYTIQDTHTLKMISKAKLIDGLYVLDVITSVVEFGIHVAIVAHVRKTTWDKRLGHLSFKRLDSI